MYVLSIILIIFLFALIKYNFNSTKIDSFENMADVQNAEAIANIAKLYNTNDFTVTNATITNKLKSKSVEVTDDTVANSINAKNINSKTTVNEDVGCYLAGNNKKFCFLGGRGGGSGADGTFSLHTYDNNNWVKNPLMIDTPTSVNLNNIRFTDKWSAFTDTANNRSEISNDTDQFKTLMIVGNKSGNGSTRTVGVWDKLTVNGELEVKGPIRLGPWTIYANSRNELKFSLNGNELTTVATDGNVCWRRGCLNPG